MKVACPIIKESLIELKKAICASQLYNFNALFYQLCFQKTVLRDGGGSPVSCCFPCLLLILPFVTSASLFAKQLMHMKFFV